MVTEEKAKKAKGMDDEELYWPEGIIHHIMSYLNPQESAQVSFLSKAWLSAWHTKPKLEFHDKYFHRTRHVEQRQKFRHHVRSTLAKHRHPVRSSLAKYRHHVRSSLAKYEEEDINILEFNLVQAFFDLCSDDASFLDQQLQSAIKRGVKVIRLSFNSHRYSVPSFILEAKSLTDLYLSGCCKFQDNKLFLCSNIRRLHLKEVQIDEEMFCRIFQGCPLIEDLLIHSCDNLKVINLPNLKKLDVGFFRDSPSPIIEIDAPCLESLKFESLPGFCFGKLHPLESLRDLQLTKTCITDIFLDNLISNFPGIQVLKLNSCNGFKRINVASKSLKHLCLYSTPPDVKEVQVDAPNMTRFEYDGVTFGEQERQICRGVLSSECVSLISTTPNCHERECGGITLVHHLDRQIGRGVYKTNASGFLKLNELISNFSPSKVSLSLHISALFSNPMCLGDIPTCAANPAKLEELSIDITNSGETSLEYSRLLDGVFWACHPKALVVQTNSRNREFREFLYNELIKDRRNRKACNLLRSSSKFWQHSLKNAELEISNKAGITTRRYPELILPFNTLKLVFKLEWNGM